MVSGRHEFLQGVRDILPMVIGTLPFAVIFGGLAVAHGLSPWQALGMSLLVFAGSAQFIGISLIGSGAGLTVLLLTTLVLNLRHALYSASLQPFVRHLPKRWRVPLAFWLTDEAFAVVRTRYARADASPHKHCYYAGAALCMYLNWQLFTLVGALFGQAVPGLADWGLDFAMLATFIALVVPTLRNRPQIAAALLSAAVALCLHGLPYKLGLMFGALAGIAVGLLLQPRGGGREAC